MEREDYVTVTEVLATYAKLDMVPPDVLERACQRGTDVHAICGAYLKGFGIPEIPEDLSGYFDSFKSWHSTHDSAEFYFPERFYADDLQLSGECDCIMRSGDKVTLVDFKTSAKESPTWPLQGAAYRFLASEMNIDVQDTIFIKLHKDGSPATVFPYEYEVHRDLFFKALDLYKYFNPKKKKRKSTYVYSEDKRS